MSEKGERGREDRKWKKREARKWKKKSRRMSGK